MSEPIPTMELSPQEQAELLDLARHAGAEACKIVTRTAMLGTQDAAPSIVLNAALMLLLLAGKTIVCRQLRMPALTEQTAEVTLIMQAIGRGITRYPDAAAVQSEIEGVLRELLAARGSVQ